MALDTDDYAVLQVMVGKLEEIGAALRRIADTLEQREERDDGNA